jgi:V/A-type H+-transporting ATPase subunit C
VHFTEFLSHDLVLTLAHAKDGDEIVKRLESTAYGSEIDQAAASYQGTALAETAINRTFVRRNRLAYDASPFAGRPVVAAYLRRWDIQNIGLILSAKAQGRPVTETEPFLVSSREIPAGLFAGTMTLDDFRLLLQQPTLEAIASSLVRFGYGGVLLPLLEPYNRTHDIFPLLHALDREYYRQVLEAARYFQGDEGAVRWFIQSEIDVRNVLLVLKGKDVVLPLEEVSERIIDGGELSRVQLADLYAVRTVRELVTSLETRYPTLSEGNLAYETHQSLTGYETALQRDRAVTELRRLRTFPLSLSVIFAYFLIAELERADLRRIIYGKVYAVTVDELTAALVVPRLPA